MVCENRGSDLNGPRPHKGRLRKDLRTSPIPLTATFWPPGTYTFLVFLSSLPPGIFLGSVPRNCLLHLICVLSLPFFILDLFLHSSLDSLMKFQFSLYYLSPSLSGCREQLPFPSLSFRGNPIPCSARWESKCLSHHTGDTRELSMSVVLWAH